MNCFLLGWALKFTCPLCTCSTYLELQHHPLDEHLHALDFVILKICPGSVFVLECTLTAVVRAFLFTLRSSCLTSVTMALGLRSSAIFHRWLLGNALEPSLWQNLEPAGEDLSGRSRTCIIYSCKAIYTCFFSMSSDLQGVKTYAKRDGTDWILNGSKVWETQSVMQRILFDIL